MKPQSDSNQVTLDAFPVRSPRSRTAITFARKKRKKTGWNPKATQKKLELLRQTLNPIPFVPAKTLDFESHQDLLKRLCLWDFVHIKFDRSIRADLLAQLIVNFNPQARKSYVNGLRIPVNRPDLGRALKLPVTQKSRKSSAVEDGGSEEQAAESEESIAFLQDLVSNWMLLHEDMCMMPDEVMGHTKAIREGQFGKVDWAGLIWHMVNDELVKGPMLENCYYASHLQHLMKTQREDLFSVKQEAKMDIDLKDDDEEEEDEDVKTEDVKLEDDDIKLCLRQENASKVDVQHGSLEKVEAEQENVEKVEVEQGNVEKIEVVEQENVEKVEVEQGNAEKIEVVEQGNAEKIEVVEQGNAENVDVVEQGNAENVDVVEQGNAENVDVIEQENVVNVDAVEKVNVGNVNVAEQENAETVGDAGQANELSVDVELEDMEKVDLGKENAWQEKVEVELEKFDSQQDNAEKVETVEKVSVEAEWVEVEDEDEDAMDLEECKDAEPAQWVLAGKDDVGEPCLLQCNLGGVKDFVCGDERNKNMVLGAVGEEEQEEDEIEEEEEEEEEEDEGDDQEGGFHLLPKGFCLEGFTSGSVTEGMDGMPMHDHFGLEFPSPRDLMLPGSSLLYGNGSKREMRHENDDSHHGPNGNKRLRTFGPWDGKMTVDFEKGMDQMQQLMGKVEDMHQWMGKAKMMYAAKEHECQQAITNQQYVMQEMQKRDDLIDHLHKARFEDQQKLQTEKFRFEHEVHLMKNLLDGYRRALKSTQKVFSEYRARHPQAVEPLYRDVPGSGGLILSTTELEKLLLKQEEEERMNRLAIETMIEEFEAGWVSKLEAHNRSVEELTSNRLVDIENEVKLLKEGLSNKRILGTQEYAPNES